MVAPGDKEKVLGVFSPAQQVLLYFGRLERRKFSHRFRMGNRKVFSPWLEDEKY